MNEDEEDEEGKGKKLFANFGQFTLFRCPVSHASAVATTSRGEHHISNDFDDQLSRSPRLTLSGEMGTETFFPPSLFLFSFSSSSFCFNVDTTCPKSHGGHTNECHSALALVLSSYPEERKKEEGKGIAKKKAIGNGKVSPRDLLICTIEYQVDEWLTES